MTKYVGSGKKMSDGWLKVSINPDKIQEHIQEFNGNKFVRLNINISPEPNDYGKDVSISVDEWEPEILPKTQVEETKEDNKELDNKELDNKELDTNELDIDEIPF